MKKIITSAALIFVSAFAFGQDNYTVKMNVKVEGLPPEYASFGEQEMVTYVKGDKTRTEMTSMMGSNISVFDGKTLTSLNEAMGNKSGFTASKAELDANKEKDSKEPKPKVEYTTEKKTIAGYECTKAIVTSITKDKKEKKTIVYVTEKIKMPETKAGGGRKGMMADFGDLKGYPLEIEMNESNQGMDMKILVTTTEVSTANIEDSMFSVSTDGYKMMTYSEFKEQQKKMSEGH